ncbi:MAG: 1,4-alpha-glucan branching protein GlgB [Candidatus Acidiferrales bacterium]
MARVTNTGTGAETATKLQVHYDVSLLTDQDLHLFNEGTHYRLYEKLGAHRLTQNDVAGTHFAVWAPNARRVGVMGEFNGWNANETPLGARGNSGIWEGFVAGVERGAHYKYMIESHHRGFRAEKADPFAIFSETPPKTASIVWDLDYTWGDESWMRTRGERNTLSSPVSVYEVHLGSWMRVREEGNRSLSYRELAPRLADYVARLGFTHVEFLPVMEHPFFGSWGYQVTGFFAPTSRFGTPQDFMYLVDYLHQRGIGVILDWVPSHFPTDGHGLSYFDGTHLYEHEDPRQGLHRDWGSLIFNYGRNEVRSFLMSSATYWLDKFHADGLRVDAVASMLYLDYSRNTGEWIPNKYGGRENVDAIEFLRHFNQAVYREHPEVQTIAEESTSWPMVSRPVYVGGLGFGMKWDMGWMHDTLKYMSLDPIHRKFHHNQLTFRMLYAFHENFMLPLSHDEVVHGKGSLLGRMPGDEWQKFANLRLLFASMFFHAGKKLIFMGGEFGQWQEWNHDASIEWSALTHPPHAGMQQWVADLNRFYRAEPAMHELDCDPVGFEWVDCNDSDNSILTLLRKGTKPNDVVLVACNYTPVARTNYRVGVDRGGFWTEALNSDAVHYGGSGWGNMGGLEALPFTCHGRSHCLMLTLPPLSAVFFKAPSS